MVVVAVVVVGPRMGAKEAPAAQFLRRHKSGIKEYVFGAPGGAPKRYFLNSALTINLHD